MTHLQSPVTNSGNVILQEELSCQTITEAYERDYNIDVSRYFQGIECVKIYKCLDTGYRFYFPFTMGGDSQLYEHLRKKPGYYGIRQEHEVAEAFFEANDLVLEIGCGDGFFLKNLQQKGILVTGLEFNEDAVIFGQKKGLNILNQDIAVDAQQHPEKYDVVCCFQVLEHITEVHNFIAASLEALKIGGKLIVAVPNNNPFLYKHDKYHTLNFPPHHMGLWDATSLANIEKVFNMRVERILIERLQEYEREYYFKIQAQKLKAKAKALGAIYEKILLSMRPTRIRCQLQKTIARLVQGRNILAVYIKH